MEFVFYTVPDPGFLETWSICIKVGGGGGEEGVALLTLSHFS